MKYLPARSQYTELEQFRMFWRILLATAVSIILLAFGIRWAAPFGRTVTVTVSGLMPPTRVTVASVSGQPVYRQTDDLVYFTVPVTRHYDTAKLTVTFQNPWPDQDIYAGVRDQEEWHYLTKLIDAPLLNRLAWNRVGADTVLYEKEKRYASLAQLLSRPPSGSVIGLYKFDPDIFAKTNFSIPGYAPKKTHTVIETPLRGSHTLYAYLANEPFWMKLSKQDLNWYPGTDIVTVDVYKEGDVVYRTSIPDDGSTDGSGHPGPTQAVLIRNSGPGLPEPGVYKIVIDATGDSIIRRIETNLHKLVFDGPVYPVANHTAYPSVVASTSATVLYTQGTALSVSTPHTTSVGDVVVNGERVRVPAEHQTVRASLTDGIQTVTVPQSDMVINGIPGYFAFSPDALFSPFRYNTFQITQAADLENVDYLVAQYSPGTPSGMWRTATVTFPLSTAVTVRGALQWIIRAPHLSENGRTLTVTNISLTLTQHPSVRLPMHL